MGAWGIGHWIVVLLIVVLVFGTKKLKNIGGDLGSAVKGFKDGMKGEEGAGAPAAQQQVTNAARQDSNTVDVDAKTKS